MRTLLAAVRLVHPAPTVAVVALAAALAVILASESGGAEWWRVALLVASVAGSQVFTGALNDWADRDRDARTGRPKPIPSGQIAPAAALAIAALGLALQVATSAPLGWAPLGLGLVASASAAAYNLWLSRTPLSIVPYLVSFGVLPLWIAAGIGVPLARVAPAALLVAPFAAAAHLANTLRDFELDARDGSRALAQRLGRRTAHRLAVAMAIGVGLVVGAALLGSGRGEPATLGLGGLGLAAIALGVRGPEPLWRGMLVAAVSWTAAWGLATG